MKKIIKNGLLLVSTIIVSCVLFQSAFGQTETGQIVGTVVDSSGAVVPGAKIELKNIATTAVRNIVADDEGVFVTTNLQPGEYSITAKSGSFSPTTVRVSVSVGGRTETKITLSTTVAEEVTVTGGGLAEVNTVSQDIGNVVSQKQITELPNLTRNPYAAVSLSGNVSTNDPSGRGVGVAINGLRAASTEILLDGTSNVDAFVAGVGQNVPLDSVDQFRVISGSFSAEYGRASGGVVNVSTKSGSNQFHGTAYEFNRNSRFASNSYDNNANNIKKGTFNRNQFGYSIGGPIVHDKLFFFSSTEWVRVRSSQNVLEWVLDPAYLGLTPGAGGVPAGFASTKAFFTAFGALAPGVTPTGKVIKASEIPGLTAGLPGATSLNVLRQITYQAPVDQGAGSPQNGWQTVNRADYNLSERTQIYGRFTMERNGLFNGTLSRSPYDNYSTGQNVRNWGILGSVTHLFTPTFVLQSKVNFNRLITDQPLSSRGSVPTLYTLNGRASTNFLAAGNPNRDGNSVVHPGYLPTSPNTGIPFGGPQNFLQFYEDLSYTRGNHSLRFGGQFVNLKDNRTFGAYQTAVELLANSASNYTTAFNNLLNGSIGLLQVAIDPKGLYPGDVIPAGFTVSSPNFTRNNRYNEWALYFNDSWRIAPRFTANLGVRYEYYGVQHNKDKALDSNVYYGAGSDIFQTIKNARLDLANNHGGLWSPDKNNWAARLGFAWDLFGDGKTSIRAGYARAFERNFGNVTFNIIQNPPNYATVTVPLGAIQTTNTPVLGPPLGSGCASNQAFCPGRPLPPTSTRWVDPNIVNAYADQWSASFSHRLMKETTLSVEYTGSAGRKLYSIEDPNPLESALARGGVTFPGTAAALATANGCPASYIANGVGFLNYFGSGPLTRLNCRYTTMNRRTNGGLSDYRALITSVESNNFLDLGILFTSRYTWGVSKDNLSSTFSESGNNFNLGLLDAYNPRLDYGYSDFDTRHRWVSSFVYEVPFGKDMESWKKHLFSGWSITGVASLESGAPFTIYDTTTGFQKARRLILNNAVNFGAPGALIPVAGVANQFQWNVIPLSAINTSFVPQAAPGVNTGDPCGTGLSNGLCFDDSSVFPADMLPRNSFRGPGFWNADLGVYKRIRISEKYALQFRAEAFNVFNHANLFVDTGDVDVWDPVSGVQQTKTITASKQGRRNVQLAIKFIF